MGSREDLCHVLRSRDAQEWTAFTTFSGRINVFMDHVRHGSTQTDGDLGQCDSVLQRGSAVTKHENYLFATNLSSPWKSRVATAGEAPKATYLVSF